MYIYVYIYVYVLYAYLMHLMHRSRRSLKSTEMPTGRSDIPPILRISDGERFLSDLRPKKKEFRRRKPLEKTTWYEVHTMHAFRTCTLYRRLWLAKRADTHLHIRHENAYTSDIMKLHINCSIGEGGASNRTN